MKPGADVQAGVHQQLDYCGKAVKPTAKAATTRPVETACCQGPLRAWEKRSKLINANAMASGLVQLQRSQNASSKLEELWISYGK